MLKCVIVLVVMQGVQFPPCWSDRNSMCYACECVIIIVNAFTIYLFKLIYLDECLVGLSHGALPGIKA